MLFVTGVVIELALMPVVLFHFHRAGPWLWCTGQMWVAIPLVTFVSTGAADRVGSACFRPCRRQARRSGELERRYEAVAEHFVCLVVGRSRKLHSEPAGI